MSAIKVFAPASVSNLSCGFDILGFAIHGPGDEIVASFCDKPGIHIEEIKGDNGKLPYETEKNTAGVAALETLRHLGKEDSIGISLKLHKKMPFSSGMGSSAASAVAGAMAVNELLGCPLSKLDLIPFIAAGEKLASGAIHLDNVAPSLLGGMVFIRDNKRFDVHQIPTPKLYCSLLYPEIPILTADARAILSDSVLLKQHITQSANLGALLVGFFKSDYSLIKRSLKDVIIEPQRSKLIKGFYEVQNAAISAGALGCSISGAGPSIYALSKDKATAEQVGNAMKTVYDQLGINNQLFISTINATGATKI